MVKDEEVEHEIEHIIKANAATEEAGYGWR